MRFNQTIVSPILATTLFSGRTSAQEKLGLRYFGATHARNVTFLVDETWVDADGVRSVDQEIFGSVFQMIDEAEQFILLDLFLLNDFGFEPGDGLYALSQELTDRLIAKKITNPAIEVVFISDPVNTVYGSCESSQFKALDDAGVNVVWTDLDQLRDSHFGYSKIWRVLFKPFGVGPGNTFKNPMGNGRVSIRSFAKMLNFKANHRKVVVTEKSLVIMSANPHSASSAHWNVGLRVDGAGMDLVCAAESAILTFSGHDVFVPEIPVTEDADAPYRIELLTEGRIREKVLALLADAASGTRIELCMFYLSERRVIDAFIAAQKRGCDIRVILDPSKDAFGMVKNGIPNRQSGARLHQTGIPLRWADTHGEQCHVKMLYVEHSDGQATLLLGSCNYTRRNMDNFNCEADLALTASVGDENMQRVRAVFERWWNNSDGRTYTTEYATYEDQSRWRRGVGWWLEMTGMGTF